MNIQAPASGGSDGPHAAGTNQILNAGRRIPAVDALRGAALVAMILYHLTWDLAYVGFAEPSLPLSPPLRAYARAVAIVFLLLVGVSLRLANPVAVDVRKALRRIGVIALASGAITLVTAYAFPQEAIVFGTLHCIAAASLLALPFVRAPALVQAVMGLAILLVAALVQLPALNGAVWQWVGLGTTALSTLDDRPLFPWAGFVFLGLAASAPLLSALRRWDVGTRAGVLQWAGRHSLLVYLLHQPPLVGLLLLAASVAGPRPAEGQSAQIACERRCTAGAICPKVCSCVVRELRSEAAFAGPADDAAKTDEGTLAAIVRDCEAAARLP